MGPGHGSLELDATANSSGPELSASIGAHLAHNLRLGAEAFLRTDWQFRRPDYGAAVRLRYNW